ncbi:MAG: hypothetical protein JXA61_06305 [Bacteroidales bacterium]|nr:hypothetical protein [Bacteroidales bacterium]
MATIAVFAVYSLYVYQHYVVPKPEIIHDFSFWGKSFLFLALVMVAAQIIVHIVFAIINKIVTKKDIPVISDEMDKIIELKSLRVSHLIFAGGTFLAIGSQAFGIQQWIMFAKLFSSGFIVTILSDITRISLYRKGL